jgi:hypothetical protein
MSHTGQHRPKLRPVEGFPIQEDGRTLIVLHDPTGLAENGVALSPPAYLIAALMDGCRDTHEIQAEFHRQTQQTLPSEVLDHLIETLAGARYLDGPEVEEHYRRLASSYRVGTRRESNDLRGIGLSEDETLNDMFARMFPGTMEPPPQAQGIRGLIAPHLDYARGWECYARAYSSIRSLSGIRRFVILGTNHFGRAPAVVATDKDFVTPLGTAPVDRAFLVKLTERCGTDLCAYEYDHVREHSVELQVLILQSLFPADQFQIVPFLCPDPSGPTGTNPLNGEGIDLRRFAEHLRDLLAEDPTPTLLIAGADLSHVGRRFGDDRDLDPMFLHQVSERDQRALIAVRENDPGKFRQIVAEDSNPTRICSAGCIYALLTALPRAEPKLLRYDQAVLKEQDTCVTCAAFVLTEPAPD